MVSHDIFGFATDPLENFFANNLTRENSDKKKPIAYGLALSSTFLTGSALITGAVVGGLVLASSPVTAPVAITLATTALGVSIIAGISGYIVKNYENSKQSDTKVLPSKDKEKKQNLLAEPHKTSELFLKHGSISNKPEIVTYKRCKKINMKAIPDYSLSAQYSIQYDTINAKQLMENEKRAIALEKRLMVEISEKGSSESKSTSEESSSEEDSVKIDVSKISVREKIRIFEQKSQNLGPEPSPKKPSLSLKEGLVLA
jgi:hypothetical protein